MHTAIEKMIPERLANRCSYAIKLDFSKGFNKVDRSRLIKILKGLNLDDFSVRAFEPLYLDSKAVNEIIGFLSTSFKILRIVRQECALSAFLFIFFRNLLQVFESFRLLCPKLISYADYITCLINFRSFDRLFRFVRYR